MEPGEPKPDEEYPFVVIVRFSGILICKSAPRKFRLVFNELRGWGGFQALDNLGLSAGSILGFAMASLPACEPGSEVTMNQILGNESSNIRKNPPIFAQNPTKSSVILMSKREDLRRFLAD